MGELLAVVLQVVGELLLQLVVEVLGELGLHSVRETFRRPEPVNPVFAAIGYAILGAAAGGISLLVVPKLMIEAPGVRVVNLLVTPVIAGLFMALIGAWRSRHGRELIRLDRFGFGFLFALAMASVRLVWAHH